MKLKKVIIGFAGKPQVGKTTAADYIAGKYGAQHYFIGDAIKEQMDAMLRGVGLRYSEKKKTLYRPLISWISLYRRSQDPDYWSKVLLKKIKLPAVISDIRFIEDIKLVDKHGGVIWKIDRTRDTNQDNLATETALDNYKFDEIIDNNSSKTDLYRKLDALLVKYKLLK